MRGDLRICAEAPHHITAFFRPIPGPGPGYSGSVGAGLAVEPPARLCLGKGGVRGEAPWFPAPPHASMVASRLGAGLEGARIVHPLPPGAGYAASGASAVLGALAASTLRSVPLLHSLRVAHEVEVEMGTGLGDVAAIYCGVGVVIRYTPGPPGDAMVDCIPVDQGLVVVVGEAGRMATGELLRVYRGEDWWEASRSLERLARNPHPAVFLEEAERFTRARRLDERMLGFKLEDVVRAEGVAGYYVKKKLAVVVVDEDSAQTVAESLRSRGLEVRLLRPSLSPPRLTPG